jgi:DNA-binding GntR family transcriptional regulator
MQAINILGHNIGTMKTEKSIPAQVLDFIRLQGLTVGSHLPAQSLADWLNVSRSPVNNALNLLHEKGVLTRESNRGFFLAKSIEGLDDTTDKTLGLDETSAISTIYFRIADDLLKGSLPETISEAMLKARYELTAAQLQALLNRISLEGWVQKKPGYGWVFSTMLTTPDSLLQSYRLRLAIEPAALLEPGYHLDSQVLARCRAAELSLLNGGIDTATADQLHERGVRFHESLVAASGNPFFIDAIRRVNSVRRLLSYRSMKDRARYKEHCLQHLHVLDLLEKQRNVEASEALRNHLASTLKNLSKITSLLAP